MAEIWILGAAGRTGVLTARDLAAAGADVVLVGRSAEALKAVAGPLGARGRILVADSIAAMAAELRRAGPVVVANFIGPFAQTAAPIVEALAPGSGYLDLSNELEAALWTLAQHDAAVASNRCLVSGAGWGVLAAEAAMLRACEGRPPATRARVDVAPFVDAAGPLGHTLAATIVESVPGGTSVYRDGRLTRVATGGHAQALTAPDGHSFTTAAIAFGDLEAARRASGAPAVVAASTAAPSGALAGLLLPVVSAIFSLRAVRDFATARLAKVNLQPAKGPPRPSWAHARADWADGTVRETWLKAGDGTVFTARVAAEVALRLSRGEGRPGAYTPGALFGAALAEAAGAEITVV